MDMSFSAKCCEKESNLKNFQDILKLNENRTGQHKCALQDHESF